MYIFKEILISVILLCAYCGVIRYVYREMAVGKKGK
jgi:hypothetical protein